LPPNNRIPLGEKSIGTERLILAALEVGTFWKVGFWRVVSRFIRRPLNAGVIARLETLWKNSIFGLCGIDKFRRKVFNIVVVSSKEQRERRLSEIKQFVTEEFSQNMTTDKARGK
jgi:uncharacterized protein YlxP (DUF503 family)